MDFHAWIFYAFSRNTQKNDSSTERKRERNPWILLQKDILGSRVDTLNWSRSSRATKKSGFFDEFLRAVSSFMRNLPGIILS